MAALLNGAQGFCDPGLLSVDEVFSPEQTVIDMEIIEYCQRFVRGLRYDEETSSIDSIHQVGAGGSFLEHDTTLAHFRDAFASPDLFEHSALATWRQNGGQSVRQRAREIARQRIADHDYCLDKDRRDALDRIVKKAEDVVRRTP